MPPIAFENLVKASEEKRREEDYFAPDPVDCRIRSRDVPVEKGLYHIPHCGNAAWVYVPKCRLNEEDYFHTYESSRWMHGLDYDDPRFLRGYLDSLDHDNLRRAASIEESADGSITINPGLRRYPKPSERKVAEGIYYLGFVPSKHWSCDHPKPDFYNELVAPHVMGRKAPTPVEWITMRLQYAHGHGSEMCGRDYSPGQIEHSYRFMAELVCNPMPEALIPERKYTLSESGKHLFSRLTALCDPSALPEAAVFVLENEALFSLETLEHPDFKGFLEKLPIALENGLVIDRVSELVQDLVRRGIDTTEAVLHSARLTAGIYGGEEKPWWFKEDFRLRPSRGGTSNISAATLRREERLAELSGFAYMYARSVYYRAGRKLRAFEGTSEEDVLKFTSSVASSYGIGNLPRAESVIEFAVELLKDTAPDQRPEALARFAATAIRVAPSSPAMGALEGTETVISTPGLPAFLWTHLGEDAKADEMTVRPHHLRLLGGRLETLSLPERAKLPLPLNIPPSDTPLLTEHVPLDVLALPPVRNEITAQNAIMGWLEFDQQLFDECGEGGRDIAPVYWTFCANKMPDPMRPPPGFLRLIQKFYYIPEPRIDLIDIWSPFADHSLAKRNAQIRVDRWALLSSLLDASILGLIPFERVQQTLQEITFEFEAEKEAQRQKVRDENPGKDDECLVQDLYHATEELQGKENRIQVARLRGLEGVSRVMSLMTTAGLLPGAQVDFGEGLDSFVENAAKRPGFARPLFQLLERESGSLKQLAALGIISVPELIHFLNEAPRESLRSGARKLKVLADAVQEANKLTADRFWSAEVTGGSITEALVSIRNIQLKTVKRCRKRQVASPLST